MTSVPHRGLSSGKGAQADITYPFSVYLSGSGKKSLPGTYPVKEGGGNASRLEGDLISPKKGREEGHPTSSRELKRVPRGSRIPSSCFPDRRRKKKREGVSGSLRYSELGSLKRGS